ncbi:Tetratricopeptide repeat [Musa troglodytarum]|uniref:Tetratricopeptide repeat n=1 Tax=Musa troglodytarum TaxID=320322 RepID=A0A9E7LE98_9LILI|nr:Tetratricopeptide repeat [Musa troglodytarum]
MGEDGRRLGRSPPSVGKKDGQHLVDIVVRPVDATRHEICESSGKDQLISLAVQLELWKYVADVGVCSSEELIVYRRYQKAVQWFEMTLDCVSSSLSEMWEPTLVNLAHALRKLKQNIFRMFQKAISCYEKALAVSTQNFSAFAGLAYTYHLQDNFDAAITYYHKALWLDPNDQFCTEMLTLALEDDCRGVDRRK